jgi:predicted transcriptional regulator of viral defense system
MRNKHYTNFIRTYINELAAGAAFHTRTVAVDIADAFNVDLAHAREIVNVYLKRLADEGTITRIKKGLYGKNKMTVFGKVEPDKTEIIAKIMLRDKDDIIGYNAGPTLLNFLGLTTQIPRDRTIATNHYRHTIPEDAGIKAKKPLTKVTSTNAVYLQIIDAVKAMNRYPIDAEKPEAVMSDMIERLYIDKEALLRYANTFCNNKELRMIVRMAFGEATKDEAT